MRENSCRFLGASTTESNQCHSKPAAENESHNEGQEGVANMICKLFQQQGAPEVEVDKFSGNALKYQYFSAMFKVVLERKIKDPAGRLTHLINFTDGEAKDLIKNCMLLTPDIGFNTAIMLLNKSCNGNPHSLLASNRKEIELLALVKPGNAMGFRKFHNFVKCETFSTSTNCNSLETPESLCALVSKLPGGLRDRPNIKVQVKGGVMAGNHVCQIFPGF